MDASIIADGNLVLCFCLRTSSFILRQNELLSLLTLLLVAEKNEERKIENFQTENDKSSIEMSTSLNFFRTVHFWAFNS